MMRRRYKGIDKPEPLKGTLKGLWSRSITEEHRLVYSVIRSGDEPLLLMLQCRYHH